MEYFDVYDVNRKPLGYTKKRGEKLEKDEYNTGVEIWIINDKKLLMGQRSLTKSHPGSWEVPGGCSISGEKSIDTLKRELKEELGLFLDENKCELITTEIYKNQFVDIYQTNMICDINKVNLQTEEVMNVKFVTKDEFLKMANNNKIVPSVYNRYEIIKDKLKKDW